MTQFIFADRTHAGQLLASALRKYADRTDVIVLGLPRGGVPVAFEVAKRLHAPLDVMVVRKLGVPGWEELAMGALASGGVRVINEDVVRGANIPQESIERATTTELQELQRREVAYRGHHGAPDVTGKTVILVDDGIATGSTILAAVQALHKQQAAHIVVGVPTASAESCDKLQPLVDELIVLMRPVYFHSVSQWYENFQQTTDQEVKQLMQDARAFTLAHTGSCS